MAASEYVRWLRSHVGTAPVLLPSASAMIFDGQRRVLMVRPEGRDDWVIPGGCVDPGEHPEATAVREAKEETGLDIEIVKLMGVFAGPDLRVTYDNGDIVDYVMTTYSARIAGGTLAALDGELAEMRFATRDEMVALNLAPWARTILPDLFGLASPRLP